MTENIAHKTGDIFTSTAEVIGHGVNTVGVMGAGIAKTVREKYPSLYSDYYDTCYWQRLTPGNVHLYELDTTPVRFIANIATQENPGPVAEYSLVLSGMLQTFREMENRYLETIALPQIGCGIGGLKWHRVQTIIAQASVFFPSIDIELWTYEKEN